MLKLAPLAVIVLLGIAFLVFFFISLCRESHKGHAIVFIEVLNGQELCAVVSEGGVARGRRGISHTICEAVPRGPDGPRSSRLWIRN